MKNQRKFLNSTIKITENFYKKKNEIDTEDHLRRKRYPWSLNISEEEKQKIKEY